jgi:hypothetical protein
VTSEKKNQQLRGNLIRFVLFGMFTVLCVLAVTNGAYVLAGLLGMGAVFTGRRLLDRKGTMRRELWRWARENARQLSRVAREDRTAAPQMKRLEGLQAGLLESWELLPEGYWPLLDEDIYTIMGEVEGLARLARRRAGLRRHLESVDRLVISRRIETLEQEVVELGETSPLRAPLETALDGRRGELASCTDILEGISMINAQLEGAESLLSNLRGELLALDTGLAPGSPDTNLARLKSQVAYFRQSMDQVARDVDRLPAVTPERLPAR